MPRVPTAQEAGLGGRAVEPVGPAPQSFALPSILVPRDGGGEALTGFGRAASGLGATLGGIAGELAEGERRQRDAALLAEAELAGAKAVGGLLRDPESGYLATEGRQALLARAAALRGLEAIGRRALGGLEPGLRPAFQALWASRRHAAAEAIDGHSRTQFGVWLDRVDLERIGAARTAALEARGAPEAVGEALAEGQAALGGFAERHGWPPEERRRAEAALRAQTHEAVLRSLLEQEDFGRARAYLRNADAELGPGERRRLEPLLAEARDRAAELARGATAGRLLGEWRAAGLDAEAQRAAAGRLRNPGLRALVTERLERAEAGRERARREAEIRALSEARRAVEQGAPLEDLPFAVLRRLGEPQRRALAAHARHLAAGERPPSDLAALHRLRRLAADAPEAFVALDLFTEARAALEEGDFAALEQLQAALAAERRGRADAAQLALLDREAAVEGAVEAALGRRLAAEGREPEGEEKAAALGAFGRALRRRVEAAERRHGRALEDERLDALAQETFAALRDRFPPSGEAASFDAEASLPKSQQT